MTRPRGIYRVRALTVNGSRMSPYRLIVRPASGVLAITGVESLTRSDDG